MPMGVLFWVLYLDLADLWRLVQLRCGATVVVPEGWVVCDPLDSGGDIGMGRFWRGGEVRAVKQIPAG